MENKEIKTKIDYKEIDRRQKLISWFGNVQLSKLLENAHKGKAGLNNIDNLLKRLDDEVKELHEALNSGSHQDIIRECGDVANFAMFIADFYNDNKQVINYGK